MSERDYKSSIYAQQFVDTVTDVKNEPKHKTTFFVSCIQIRFTFNIGRYTFAILFNAFRKDLEPAKQTDFFYFDSSKISFSTIKGLEFFEVNFYGLDIFEVHYNVLAAILEKYMSWNSLVLVFKSARLFKSRFSFA